MIGDTDFLAEHARSLVENGHVYAGSMVAAVAGMQGGPLTALATSIGMLFAAILAATASRRQHGSLRNSGIRPH